MSTLYKLAQPLALAVLCFLPIAHSQLVISLPTCVQDCIEQSEYDNCDLTDIGCLCRASAGNFLPNVITCMHGECDNSLDNNLLLTPLQLACEIAGSPIPESALANAENIESSLASQVTTTVTMTAGQSTASSGYVEATTTTETSGTATPTGEVSTVTVTSTNGAETLYIAYPVTIWSTTTASGVPSTITSSAVSTVTTTPSFTVYIPVVITSTDSSGSSYTSTTSELGAISTYTTTNSKGKTTTDTTTYTQTTTSGSTFTTTTRVSSSASSTGQSSSSSTTGTSIEAQKTTSKTSSPNPQETEGAPFTGTNEAGRDSIGLRNGLGFGVLWLMSYVWF